MSPLRMAGFLVVQIIVLMGLVWVAGFKKNPERTLGQVALETVQTFGLALVESAVILFLIGRLTSDMSALEIVGKIVLEAIPVSTGIAIATSQLQASGGSEQSDGQDGSGDDSESDSDGTDPSQQWKTVRQYVKVAGGAFYMGYNFAPITEVTIIATSAAWWRLIGVAILSLAVSYGLVFALEVRGGTRPSEGLTVLERPIGETVASYGFSVAVGLLLLFMFKAVELDSLGVAANHAVVMALPCSLGAAAGRLLI